KSRRCVTRPEPVGAHSQHIAAATRGAPGAPVVALGALVLYLGALVLSQIGCGFSVTLRSDNVDPRDLRCSRRVIAASGATVFSLPGGGGILYNVSAGSMGWILDGPRDHNWWRVQFDGQPVLPANQGWVPRSLLTPTDPMKMTRVVQ